MAKIFLILSLVFLNVLADDEDQSNYDIFRDWSSKHNKQYSVNEILVRYQVWKNNYDFIQEHNSKNYSWKLAANEFADLTSEEYSALYAGLDSGLQSAEWLDSANTTAENSTATNDLTSSVSAKLRTSVDWRTLGAVSAVKNQERCGSCWTFTASVALEGIYAIKTGSLLNFTQQQLLECSSSYGNNGCDGGTAVQAFNYTSRYGIQLYSDYPYTAQTGITGKCSYNSSRIVFKNSGYQKVRPNNATELKAAVARQPVAVGVSGSEKAFQFYSSGILSSNCTGDADHAILVVGYDRSNGTDYWIVKNSYGTKWGINGYIHIAAGDQNSGEGVCSINTMPSYPIY